MSTLRIGIDVGSRAVKVAWAKIARGDQLVWHIDQRSRTVSDTPEQLEQTLRQLLRPLKPSSFSAQVIVAAPQSHIRRLNLQVTDIKQIPQAIRDELPRLFPFEAMQCLCQYRLLQQQRSNGQLDCTVEAAACDTRTLRLALDGLERVGWIPSHVYPIAQALAAVARTQDLLKEEPVLLCEIGAKRLILAVVTQGEVIVAREVVLGSEYLTEALMSQVVVGQDSLQLSWDQAESLKCKVGIAESEATLQAAGARLPLATYQALLQPVLEQWVGEIQRTVAFSVQEASDVQPHKLLLSGGGSQLIGLGAWLSSHLGMPVERLSVQGLIGTDAPAMTASCGLVQATPSTTHLMMPTGWKRDGASPPQQTSLNLLPERTRFIRRVVHAQRGAILGLVLAGVLLWIGVSGLQLNQRRLQSKVIPLEARWQTTEPVRTLATTVSERIQLLTMLTAGHSVSPEWFRRLASDFPPAVRLREFSRNADGKVQMQAQAQARARTPEAYVSVMTRWLAEEGLCKGVRLGTTRRNQDDAELVDFSLTCQGL